MYLFKVSALQKSICDCNRYTYMQGVRMSTRSSSSRGSTWKHDANSLNNLTFFKRPPWGGDKSFPQFGHSYLYMYHKTITLPGTKLESLRKLLEVPEKNWALYRLFLVANPLKSISKMCRLPTRRRRKTVRYWAPDSKTWVGYNSIPRVRGRNHWSIQLSTHQTWKN